MNTQLEYIVERIKMAKITRKMLVDMVRFGYVENPENKKKDEVPKKPEDYIKELEAEIERKNRKISKLEKCLLYSQYEARRIKDIIDRERRIHEIAIVKSFRFCGSLFRYRARRIIYFTDCPIFKPAPYGTLEHRNRAKVHCKLEIPKELNFYRYEAISNSPYGRGEIGAILLEENDDIVGLRDELVIKRDGRYFASIPFSHKALFVYEEDGNMQEWNR